MRALTIRQPWAHAIIHLGKDIENRKCRAPAAFIGEYIAIHAGKGLDRDAGIEVDHDDLVRGAILGIARVARVVTASRSRWFEGPLGWVLEDVRRLPNPIHRSGALGLWKLTPAELGRIRRAFPRLNLR